MVMVRVTLTFDLSNLKINRGHLSVMINFPTKSEDCMLKRSLVIDRTIVCVLKVIQTVTFELLTSKSIRLIYKQ